MRFNVYRFSAIALALGAFVFAATLPSESHAGKRPPDGTEIPNAKAKDCGCRNMNDEDVKTQIALALFPPTRVAGLLALIAHPERSMPHYVEAGDCSGRRYPAEGAYGWVRYSHPSTGDLPFDHDWHDANFYVDYDIPYGDQADIKNINSDANYTANANFLDYGPKEVLHGPFPVPGQRLSEVEWDSSHFPETFWPTAGDRFWMMGRYIWDCGHPDPPGYHTEIHPPTAVAFTRYAKDITGEAAPNTLTCQTRVYIHGKSGIKHYDRFPLPDPAKFDNYDSPVATRNYDFKIDLPLNNSPNREPFAKLVDLPYGGPAPVFDLTEPGTVKVHYPLALGDPSPDRKFGAVIVSGWKTPVPDSPGFTKVKVEVEKIVIRKRHTPLCQADWNLYLNVNGQWTKIPNTFGMIDGSIIPVNFSTTVDMPNTADARLIIEVAGWVSMIDSLFGARFDPLKFSLKFTDALNMIQIKKLGDLGHIEDAANEGHIGNFFRSYSLKRDDFGIGKDYTGFPGDLSSRFQELDGDIGNADTAGDFGVFYKITRQ
jgi:hypothetical protein